MLNILHKSYHSKIVGFSKKFDRIREISSRGSQRWGVLCEHSDSRPASKKESFHILWLLIQYLPKHRQTHLQTCTLKKVQETIQSQACYTQDANPSPKQS